MPAKSLTNPKLYQRPDVSAAWVAPVVREDGCKAVLKIGMPHTEADHEAEGLRLSSDDLVIFFLGGVFYVIARVWCEARAIADENAQII